MVYVVIQSNYVAFIYLHNVLQYHQYLNYHPLLYNQPVGALVVQWIGAVVGVSVDDGFG